jgi:hypothetical protein
MKRREGGPMIAAAWLLLAGAAAGQTVTGRVLDAESSTPLRDVRVSLLNASNTQVGETLTDSAGTFRIAGRGPGRYRVQLSQIGYVEYRSDQLEVPYMETVVLDIRLSRTAIPLQPLTVTARRRENYHEPTYDGVYARAEHLPTIGNNRVFMKNDPETQSAFTVRELIDRNTTLCRNPTVYWNGFMIMNQEIKRMRLESTNTSDVEAVEVYKDFLMAPAVFRDVDRPLATRPCAVVAIWPLRPDLPGRRKR